MAVVAVHLVARGESLAPAVTSLECFGCEQRRERAATVIGAVTVGALGAIAFSVVRMGGDPGLSHGMHAVRAAVVGYR